MRQRERKRESEEGERGRERERGAHAAGMCLQGAGHLRLGQGWRNACGTPPPTLVFFISTPSTHSTYTLPSAGTLQMLGQGCRNASLGTRQSRVDGILPRRGGGSRAEVYLPPKSLLRSPVLALAPGRLRIGFPLFKSPSSSFIHMSDQGQGSLGAGFRSDSRLLYLD